MIDLTGDLHISDGINDATINSKGNIFAKFINNSKVSAFGDLEIQKEIIDSNIMLSGCCKNPGGVIISSQIIAKAGIEAGKIGTETSDPVQLKVGVDEHIRTQTALIDGQIQKSLDQLQETKEKIQTIEQEDQQLYQLITEKAQAQEMAERQIKETKLELTQLKKANDEPRLNQALEQLKTLAQTAKTAETELNTIFQTQDRYARETEQLKTRIDQIENANKLLVLKKKGLREFSNKAQASPKILVQGSITQNTMIAGPNTSLTLMEDHRKCTIMEKAMEEDGLHYSTMDILDQ
ncbi:MAG: DUF342 domain-containing protein [Desulfobacter sp.]|nr:DUF342 domain-containing protein [Desulfobacter sp.]